MLKQQRPEAMQATSRNVPPPHAFAAADADRPLPEREAEDEATEKPTEEDAAADLNDGGAEQVDTEAQPQDYHGDQFFAALQEACFEKGYDRDHPIRKDQWLPWLRGVDAGSGEYPEDVMSTIVEKTNCTDVNMIKAMLKPQVPIVLRSVEAAVRVEEERLAELKRLEEEKQRARDEAERLRIQQQLDAAQQRKREEDATRRSLRGRCPANFDWHREGAGWRCNGGAHYVPDGCL